MTDGHPDQRGRPPPEPAPRPARADAPAPDERAWILPVWGWAVILWLSLPIIVMIVFGFNNTKGK